MCEALGSANCSLASNLLFILQCPTHWAALLEPTWKQNCLVIGRGWATIAFPNSLSELWLHSAQIRAVSCSRVSPPINSTASSSVALMWEMLNFGFDFAEQKNYYSPRIQNSICVGSKLSHQTLCFVFNSKAKIAVMWYSQMSEMLSQRTWMAQNWFGHWSHSVNMCTHPSC